MRSTPVAPVLASVLASVLVGTLVGCLHPTHAEPTPTQVTCSPPVRVLHVEPAEAEPLGEVTVSCDLGRPEECDRALARRACALGGDAVLVLDEGLTEPALVETYSGAHRTRSGRVLRLLRAL